MNNTDNLCNTTCHAILLDIIPERDRELGAAQAEIKALRATEALKDKAIHEVLKLRIYAVV